MIVDAHLHVDAIPALGWNLEAAECVRRLDEAGIDRGVVMTIVDAPEVNPDAIELIADACRSYPGRLDAFARIHPWYGDESVALLDWGLPRQDGFLPFEGRFVLNEDLSVLLEGGLDFFLLIIGQSESRYQRSVGPPCRTRLRNAG